MSRECPNGCTGRMIGNEPGPLEVKVARLERALEESVKLQSHYAELLNAHDGGERVGFPTASAWLRRLEETGTIEFDPYES